MKIYISADIEGISGTDRTGDRSIRYVGDEFLTVYKVFRASLLLARTAHNPHY